MDSRGQLVKSQVIGEVWQFLLPIEVLKWQALNRWMYATAVGRV